MIGPEGRARLRDPILAAGLGSATDDYPTWISSDGCRIYLTSIKSDPLGDIYVAAKTPN